MAIRRAVLPLVLIGAMLLGYSGAAPSATDVGYRDFSFSATSVLSPTGEKPQSKLWFNDGTWWGSLFNRTTEEYHIYRYDRATHAWSDTGTLIDERNTSKADTLWDGTHLYVASANQSSTSPARLYRYSYDTATQRYSIDPGFPVNITNAGMEAIVLDKDTTGKLWVTYTQGNQVYVNRSLGGNDQTWGTPFVLPVRGTTVSSDDISGVVAFDSQIGVMWSNQTDSAMYFATHTDGDADDVWQASRTAIQGPNNADDHINLKSVQADDVSGRVFAAVKTSLDDLSNPNPNAPLILLLVRGQDGSWTNHVFGRVGDHHTRPIVMIDREHRNLYMFATAPTSGGTIYYKQTALSNISFPEGKGTPFIQSTTDPAINNATSTKQNVNSTTGLLVQASDDTSKYYMHNFIDLSNGSDTTPPETTIDSGPSGTVINSSATFNFSSSESNSTFECSLDGAAYSVCTSPKDYTNLSNGSHTFEVRAKDEAGNVDATPASRTFSVEESPPPPPADTTPPETTINSGPSGTVNSSSASFAFSSDEAGSTFECKLDADTFASCTSPKAYGGLSNGSHTFEVRATDAAGNTDATPASRTWTVDATATNKVLTSVADTKISQNTPTTTYGTTSSIEADGSDPGNTGKDIYALIKWDLSAVPAGSMVSSVSVTLNVTNASNETYQAYRLKRAWVESAATWLLYAANNPWEVAGANGSLDRETQSAGSVLLPKTGRQTFALSPALAQSWLDNPASNQGIVIAHTTNADGLAFSSRESTTSSLRPQLNVTYTAP